MPALPHEGGNGEEQCGLTGRCRHRPDSPFERSHPLFECRHSRIRDTRIDMAGGLKVEEGRSMVNGIKQVRRGHVDRLSPSPVRVIGPLAGVQRQRLEPKAFRCDHSVRLSPRLGTGPDKERGA